MKKILRIARLELSTLFYSPIAWLVLVIFIFQSGLTFADLFERYTTMMKLGRTYDSYTHSIFVDPRIGFFRSIIKNLYLYIPLLTMGLMSRELSSGSVKLLLSSPIKVREIILGKFLSMAVYSFLLVTILACFGIAGYLSIEEMDVSLFISGLSGIYLLICAYSAIGLFMSCLTSYQVVAAISTLVVFAALNFIGTVWQNIDFVRDITYFLSIAGRTEEMVNGLVRTNDIFYFVIVIIIFLGLSHLKLLQGRESKRTSAKASRYAWFIAIMLLAGYITSLQSLRGYIDMTSTNRRTLTVPSQEIVLRLDGPIDITAYVNLLDYNAWLGLPANRNTNKRIFEQFSRFKPDTEVEYVYFYDSIPGQQTDPGEGNSAAELEARANRISDAFKFDIRKAMTPVQIQKHIDLLPENNRVVFRVGYNGLHTWLRLFADNQVVPSEREISTALKRLVDQPSKVYFVTGHMERDIFNASEKDYMAVFRSLSFRNSLINQGFDVDTLNLTTDTIPSGIDALVIADPRREFGEAELARISAYIDRGGNLLIAGRTGRQPVLNPILKYVGIQLKEGTPMQSSKSFPADFMTPGFAKQTDTDSDSSDLFRMDGRVVLPGSAELTFSDSSDFRYIPLLVTDSTAWNRPQNGITDSTQAIFYAERGDIKRPMILAAAATRIVSGKQQRVVVVGSADYASSGELERSNFRNVNFQFNTNVFRWFTYDHFPLILSRPGTPDNNLRIQQADVFWLRLIFLGIFPGAIALFAGVLLIRRRRQ